MVTTPEETSSDAKRLLEIVKQREKRETRFLNVCWHVRRQRWRAVLRWQGNQFYMSHRDEETAAWIADCARLLAYGTDAMSHHIRYRTDSVTSPLNFDWSGGVPPCPDPTITPMVIYRRMVDKGLPVKWKPSQLIADTR